MPPPAQPLYQDKNTVTYIRKDTDWVCVSKGHKAGVLIWKADNKMLSGQKDDRVTDRGRGQNKRWKAIER